MICPKCAYEQPDGAIECLKCGIIFARMHPDAEERAVSPGASGDRSSSTAARSAGVAPGLRERLFRIEPEDNRLHVAGRALVYLVLVIWGFRLMTSSIGSNHVGESFMHLINLPFHEAGHLIFLPFGRFMQVLGGTLTQWLVPLAVVGAFVYKGNQFGASVGLWWLGESFLDIAPYMNDARAGQLILLGGVTGREVENFHDWEILLTKLNMLRFDHLIARISFGTGVILMLLSLAWGGYILWKQYTSRP